MAAKKTVRQGSDWLTPKLQGKTFVLAGRMYDYSRQLYQRVIEAEGGTVVKNVNVDVDFVLVQESSPSGRSAAEKQADKLNRAKGASIGILGHDDFFKLFATSREQTLFLLHSGEQGVARWRKLHEDDFRYVPKPDLRGADFRKAWLHGVDFLDVQLDGADFRGADLTDGRMPEADGLRCEDACLAKILLLGQTNGKFLRANLHGAYLRDLKNCDFTAAILQQSNLNRQSYSAVSFRRANLRQASLEDSKFQDVDFTAADFSAVNAKDATFTDTVFTRAKLDGAKLDFCSLKKASLHRASLVGASLHVARLQGADLRHADLRGADLANADLRGALLDGANFENANVRGMKVEEATIRKARGLDLNHCRGAVAGPNLHALQELARRAHWLNIKAVLEFSSSRVQLEAGQSKIRSWSNWEHFSADGESWGYDDSPPSLSEAMIRLANRWPGGELQVASIQVEHKKAPRAGELPALAVGAWCEVFGLAVPGADVSAPQGETKEQRQQRLREEFLAELRGGAEGVRRWNVRSESGELAAVCPSFAGSDLSGADMTEAYFRELDFSNSRFDRATLCRSKLRRQGKFSEACFRQANLTEVDWDYGDFTSAVFDRAMLARGKFYMCKLTRASFRKSDLTGVYFHGVDLPGADLSSSNLTDTQFKYGSFDEHTRFPPGFVLPDGLRWEGQGADPRTIIKPINRLSFEEFLKRLPQHVEAARLDKALKMLKTERFQLYSRVDKKTLIGVVKSQTNPDLLYSCRLAKDGSFACCTQNMNLCGGLRGAVCKHLLVLIVGLTKAGELNPGWADAWVRASRYHYPRLEQEEMAEAFLQYKGAEAGEIDWRPTETIPEDYYAL
jgi:uncharacterized protein YjbI with pentapeptide repeats